MEEVRKITIKEAAQMMRVSEQEVRIMIQFKKIPGAFCFGPAHRRTYFVTNEHIMNAMRGGPK